MPRPLLLDPDRPFPVDRAVRSIARDLYAEVRDLPIVNPHGPTDPKWCADELACAAGGPDPVAARFGPAGALTSGGTPGVDDRRTILSQP